MSVTTGAITSIVVNGVSVELVDRGHGRPILFLHPGNGIDPQAPVFEALARGGRLLAPSHPGFGGTQLPKGMTTVDDISYFYLDLMEQLDLRDTLVVGVGLGAWLALEIATKSDARLSRLVLANAVGIKLFDRETRDMVDVWALTPDEFNALAYHDPSVGKRDYKNLPDAVSLTAARNREAYARVAWSPYMHNPKLKHRLHRVRLPALFLWGMSDRLLSEKYGRAFCASIAGARFQPIARAGHFPHIEQPDEFAQAVRAFADTSAQDAPRARRAAGD
jgi:pimeloyl-ACP methyl ester carboxylesterase